MLKITRKNTLLLGTLILTASGIICRILGFLYRIFLSRRIGAEAFGIYQLATPLYALMLSLGAGGMQTVLSRFVASYLAKKDSRRAKICLAAGCGIVVLRCVPLSPWIRIGKSKSARCLACAIRFWTESAWDREREKVREEAKKCFLPFFRLSIPTFPWICHREETQEKQVLYPEKP